MSDIKDTEGSMIELLKKKYPEPSFVVIPQVRNKAAFDATNTADAFAMGIWPSRGLHLHGFEVKCSRSDWLNEIKKPWKADAFQPFCDFWWLVTSPGIVEAGELPEGWGHYERKGRSLTAVVNAPKNENVQPIDRSMLAALLKRNDPSSEFKEKIKQEAVNQTRKEYEQLLEIKEENYNDLLDRVKEFEKASGVSLVDGWHNGTKIGEAVKAILNGDINGRLLRQRSLLTDLVNGIDKIIECSSKELVK